jgi:FRG domain
MQHYGAPTRLLDWTRSPYVALYFALREDSLQDSALWAINLKWLNDRSNALLRKEHADFPKDADPDLRYQFINRVIFSDKNPLPIVIRVSPRQINERMTVQQGELFYNLNSMWFSTSLVGMLLSPSFEERQIVSKVVLRRDQRLKFLEELRKMNIHEASLFPGPDGFARSLGVDLDISLAQQVRAAKQVVIDNSKRFSLYA